MAIDKRHIITAIIAGALLSSAAVVWAQATDDDIVLHEYFNPWDVDVSRSASSPGDSQAQPSANETQQRAPGDPPGLSVDPGADEVILGADGVADPAKTSEPYGPLDPRQQSSQLDDRTDRVDQLDYYANFEPSVVPYKRGVVQNTVRYAGGDYSFALDEGRPERVGVEGGDARDGEEVFWGSFLVRANRDERHPMPSVAASQRILEVQAEPEVAVSFERDAAGNFYIVPEYDGLLRLNVRLAAPSTYFRGQFDENVGWSQFGRVQTPSLPHPVRQIASDVLGSLGISRQMRPHDALFALIEHYRNFEGRAFPQELRGDDLYAALSREQVGVCRHRSLAFLISARALGIPTRYVYNEAHAFVEVYWPEMGWRRIDLGGAADELNYSGESGSGVHSAGSDDLPQPPNYQEELERMRQSGDEVGEEQSSGGAETDAERPGEAAEPSEAEESGEFSEQMEAFESGSAQRPDASELDRSGDQADFEAVEQAEAAADEQRAQEADGRQRVIIDAEADTPDVFRGNSLGLNGSMFTRQGQPLRKKHVRVFLGPVGSKSADSQIELGTLRTDAGGRFRGELSIPDNVSIGRWTVILEFSGDDEYRPARAE